MISTTSGTPTLERLIDPFLPVEPAGIEAEFDRIWQDAASGAYDTSSVRLRISNFIAWGTEAEAGDRFERVMETLALRHPCRSFLAVTSPDVEKLESAISAHCWRTPTGGRHICSEEILVRGRLGGEREIASAVLGLVVPELPVHLWLIGEPELLRRVPAEVLNIADRVYVDSAAGSLRALDVTGGEVDVVVIDLAWQRTAAWRELVAQFFDRPEAAREIDRLVSIEIVGGAKGVSSASLLMAGWLASSLGFSPASIGTDGSDVVAAFYDGSRGVQLRIKPSVAGAELERVALKTADAEFLVEMHADSGHMHIRSDWAANPVRRTVAPDAVDDATVLAAALEDASDQGVFRAALLVANELLEPHGVS